LQAADIIKAAELEETSTEAESVEYEPTVEAVSAPPTTSTSFVTVVYTQTMYGF
jgi:hypothetical protein